MSQSINKYEMKQIINNQIDFDSTDIKNKLSELGPWSFPVRLW